MTRVLIVGDFHIPFRASKIPKPLLEMLEEENFDKVLITGDLVQTYVLRPFKKFDMVVVRGNMDLGDARKFPEKVLLTFPDFEHKILLFHGTGIYPRGEPMLLRAKALKNGAKVIVTGHTHYPVVRKVIDVLIINPGSATGVMGGSGGLGIPTWAIAEFHNKKVKVTIYRTKNDSYDVFQENEIEV